jgi:hypothetical protein
MRVGPPGSVSISDRGNSILPTKGQIAPIRQPLVEQFTTARSFCVSRRRHEATQARINANARRSEGMHANAPRSREIGASFEAGHRRIDCSGPSASSLLIRVHLR